MDITSYIAIAIFILTYIGIAWGKIEHTVVAILGAMAILLIKIVPLDTAFKEFIDWHTIFMLISMMIFVTVMGKTGLFEYLAIKSAKMVKANPYAILIMLFVVTAIISAFLPNVTTVMLIAPIALLIAAELHITPYPYLLLLIFGSNIGGTATLIGDPPNMMIGISAKIPFMDFIKNLAPVIFVILIVLAIVYYFLFRNKLDVTNENKARIMDFNEKMMIKDISLLKKSIVVFIFSVLGFCLSSFINVDVTIIALASATIMILIGKIEVENLFKQVDWSTITFFIGLFIIVGGLVQTHVIDLASNEMVGLTKGDSKIAMPIILFFSGFLSAFVDNIPFTASMIPLIKNMESAHMIVLPLWWALSLGACLGGNGTLIGASANIVIANMSKKTEYPITFGNFLKYGMITLVISLVISFFYLYICFFM